MENHCKKYLLNSILLFNQNKIWLGSPTGRATRKKPLIQTNLITTKDVIYLLGRPIFLFP